MIVAVQREGSRPPLLVAPGIVETTNLASRISAQLGESQPVYALQRLKRNGAFVNDFSEMARVYAEQITESGLAGPYHLLGFSFGAQVAFAMAARLSANGKDLKQVVIIDDDADVHRRQFGAEHARPDLTDATAAARHAMDRNCLSHYPGTITLFRARHWVGDRRTDEASDWQYLAAGGVDVVNFACNHGEIAEQPWLLKWADQLKAVLGSDSGDQRAEAPAQFHATHYPSRSGLVPEAAFVAFAMAKQGDLAGEIAAYESARDLLPEWALINLSAAYLQNRQPQKAADALSLATQGVERVSNSHFELARLLSNQGNKAALRQLADDVAVLPARSASDFQLLGNILNLCRLPSESEAAYREALRLDPLRTECHGRLARLLANSGRYDAVFALLEPVIDARPDLLFPKELLAEISLEVGEIEKAEPLLLAVLNASPNRPRAVINYCAILEKRGQRADAIALANAALGHHPIHVALINKVADMYLASRDLEQALTAYQRSIKLRADLVPAWLGLADVLERMGRHADGIAALRGAPVALRGSDALKRRAGELLFSMDEGQFGQIAG